MLDKVVAQWFREISVQLEMTVSGLSIRFEHHIVQKFDEFPSNYCLTSKKTFKMIKVPLSPERLDNDQSTIGIHRAAWLRHNQSGN